MTSYVMFSKKLFIYKILPHTFQSAWLELLWLFFMRPIIDNTNVHYNYFVMQCIQRSPNQLGLESDEIETYLSVY